MKNIKSYAYVLIFLCTFSATAMANDYERLEKTFSKALPIEAGNVFGWMSGRCYSEHEPKVSHQALLAGKLEGNVHSFAVLTTSTEIETPEDINPTFYDHYYPDVQSNIDWKENHIVRYMRKSYVGPNKDLTMVRSEYNGRLSHNTGSTKLYYYLRQGERNYILLKINHYRMNYCYFNKRVR